MMGYRDKTWCTRWLDGECINKHCEHAFTAQDRTNATHWWGNADFPLVIGDRYTDECYYIQHEDFL